MISVIMPAYNAGKYIKESMESVIRQTFTEWELLIVDDGSTDNTALIVKEVMADEPRIKYLFQENGKQGKARNNAIRQSIGKYIAFLDADDLWVPEKLSTQIESMHITNADLVFSGFSTFENDIRYGCLQNSYHGYYKGTSGLKKFLTNNYIPILTVLVKRKAVEDVNYFSEKPEIQNAEDYHLWLKLLAAGNMFWGDSASLAYYRLHNSSATAGDRMVIFQMLAGLKELVMEFPGYENLIRNSFSNRIDSYICENNINDWPIIQRLIDLKKEFTQNKNLVFPGKQVYRILGKRAFRYLYISKHKLELFKFRLHNSTLNNS
jgi:teichuronic acid biosynthesis glycosyltransferase TuaG